MTQKEVDTAVTMFSIIKDTMDGVHTNKPKHTKLTASSPPKRKADGEVELLDTTQIEETARELFGPSARAI